MADPKNINEALLRLQASPPILTKDRDGQVGNQRTKYADLNQANEVILPMLTALGLLWVTSPTLRMIAGPNGQEDPRFVLDWEMVHVPSDTKRVGVYPLPAGANPMQNGSAITYARRYALLAITNAVAEDDDDDGGGYRGRQGMAQRANVRQQQTRDLLDRAAQPTGQRATPAARPERARPEQQPELPARPTSPAPVGDGAPARGRGGLITEPMTKKLAVSMSECGLTGDARLPYVVDLINRPITTSKELTFDEGRHLIDAFEKAKTAEDPQTQAAIIYVRTTTGVPDDAGTPGEEPARRPAKRAARTAETRTVAEQTRDAVVGTGNPDGERAPWDEPLIEPGR